MVENKMNVFIRGFLLLVMQTITFLCSGKDLPRRHLIYTFWQKESQEGGVVQLVDAPPSHSSNLSGYILIIKLTLFVMLSSSPV